MIKDFVLKNKFIVTLFGMAIVVSIVLFVIKGLQDSRIDAARDKMTKLDKTVAQLNARRHQLSDKNEEVLKGNIKRYEDSIEALRNKYVQKYEVKFDKSWKDYSRSKLKISLSKKLIALKRSLVQGGVIINESDNLGFGKYVGALPDTKNALALSKYMSVTKEILALVATSGVSRFIEIKRPDDLKSTSGKFAQTSPFSLKVKGTPQSVKGLLNSIVKYDKALFMINKVSFISKPVLSGANDPVMPRKIVSGTGIKKSSKAFVQEGDVTAEIALMWYDFSKEAK